MSRGLIKICGVTSAEDAALAAGLGADLVGINLFAGSPRCARPEIVPAIVEALGNGIEKVAVMVQPTPGELERTPAFLANLDTLQWHAGQHEPRPWLKIPLITAFGIADASDLRRASDYLAHCREQGCLPKAILIDAVARGLHGGTGKTAPWDLLAGYEFEVPIILAGGLRPENVAEAIQRVSPSGVDVASGVEDSPGRKSLIKMQRFIEAAREAFDRN